MINSYSARESTRLAIGLIVFFTYLCILTDNYMATTGRKDSSGNVELTLNYLIYLIRNDCGFIYFGF